MHKDFRRRILRAETMCGRKLYQCRRLLHNRRVHESLTDDAFRHIYQACMGDIRPNMPRELVMSNAETSLHFVTERLYASKWDALLGMLPAYDRKVL